MYMWMYYMSKTRRGERQWESAIYIASQSNANIIVCQPLFAVHVCGFLYMLIDFCGNTVTKTYWYQIFDALAVNHDSHTSSTTCPPPAHITLRSPMEEFHYVDGSMCIYLHYIVWKYHIFALCPIIDLNFNFCLITILPNASHMKILCIFETEKYVPLSICRLTQHSFFRHEAMRMLEQFDFHHLTDTENSDYIFSIFLPDTEKYFGTITVIINISNFHYSY